MTRVQRDTLGYLAIAAISVVLLAWAIPAYTPPHPGYGASPALVPNVAAAVMLVMAILALLRNALARWGGKPLDAAERDYPAAEASGGFTQVGRVRLARLLILMLPCALLVPAFAWLGAIGLELGFAAFGYIAAAFVFLMVFQYILGRREPLPAVMLATAMTLVMYVAMRYVFGVPLPGV